MATRKRSTGDSQEDRRYCRGQIEALGSYRATSAYVPLAEPAYVKKAKRTKARANAVLNRWDRRERGRRGRYDARAGKAKDAIRRAFYADKVPVAQVMRMVDAYRAKWERA